jgi:hypothetical protein
LSYEEDEDEEEEEEEQEDEDEEQEERRVVKEITDYETGKTTYLYDDGTYEDVYHDEEPSECFVVTACYGSALDKHVIFLRQFRDLEVMRTRVGRNFMLFFNALYYSFSPNLASFLARHRIPKLVTRCVIVAPTIHLLRLSRYLAKPLSNISREASVLATGMIFVLGCLIIAWAFQQLFCWG